MSVKCDVAETCNEFADEDFEWTVGLNRISLKAIGVWPDADSNKLDNIRVPFTILFILITTVLPQFYALTMVIAELPLVVDNMFSNIAMLTGTTELFFLWLNRKGLAVILDSIRSDCRRWKADWEREIMLALAKRARFFTICGYSLVFFSVGGILFSPLLGITFRSINNITDNGNRFLPTQSYYPYDYWKSPYYELSYLGQVISGAFASISVTSPVVFYCAIVYHKCSQLTCLGMKLGQLTVSGSTSKQPTLKENNTFGQRLKYIVDSHSYIVRGVNKIESSFTNLILAQIICLSMMICCIGFQILNAVDNVGGSSVSQISVLVTMFLAVLIHTLVYCIAGETLATCNAEMHRKIYETKWYTCHSSHASSLILLMIRSRCPLQLTAGKFILLNLPTFSNIIKTSAGYISMLIAVRDKQ